MIDVLKVIVKFGLLCLTLQMGVFQAQAKPICENKFLDLVSSVRQQEVGNSRAKSVVEHLFSEAGVVVGEDIVIHDDRFYGRVLADFELRMGETYMDGLWDSPQIDKFLYKLMKLQKDRPEFVKSLIFKNVPSAAISNLFLAQMREMEGLIFNQQSRPRAKIVAEEHYDTGNNLYSHMLDPTMTYTSGIWPQSENNARDFTLEDSQNAKYHLLARKMGLKPGDRVLDIGCGFGGFARFAAKNYGAKVIGITISVEQLKAARELSDGIDGVDFQFMDYRDIPFYFEDGYFDHIVSIEMIEAVGPKNLKEYFEAAYSRLKPGGRFVLQSINGGRNRNGPNNPWFHKYIFPNGVAPSKVQMDLAAQTNFGPAEFWHLMDGDYDKTLLEWNKNFQQTWDRVSQDYDDRFKRMWEFYLLSVAANFRAGGLQVNQVIYVKEGNLDLSDENIDRWTALPNPTSVKSLRVPQNELLGRRERLLALEEALSNQLQNQGSIPPSPISQSSRIAIVGGGPAGMGAAWELMKQGYTNVHVFEAAEQAGGKSHTVMINGYHQDLGATMGVQGLYSEIIKMGEISGQELIEFPQEIHFSTELGGPVASLGLSNQLKLFTQSFRFLFEYFRKTGWSGQKLEVPEGNLGEPWNISLDRLGLSRFRDLFQTYMTGYGYGYGNSPLVYALRMLTPQALFGAARAPNIMWENGTQEIWKGLANHFNEGSGVQVHFSSPVSHIIRSESGVQIQVGTSGDLIDFEKVIIATDPINALEMIDSTEEESNLFGMIEYMPYATFAVRVKGFKNEAHVGYLRENMRADRVGHPMAWIQRHDGEPVQIFHLFAPQSLSDNDVMENIERAMLDLGAESVQLEDSRRWNFFPHVNPDNIRIGRFFNRFAQIQGYNHTVFTNEALTMSTMPNSFEGGRRAAQKLIDGSL